MKAMVMKKKDRLTLNGKRQGRPPKYLHPDDLENPVAITSASSSKALEMSTTDIVFAVLGNSRGYEAIAVEKSKFDEDEFFKKYKIKRSIAHGPIKNKGSRPSS